MSVFNTSNDHDYAILSDGNAIPGLLDKNWQTTAAVAVACGTGGITGGLMLAAFPAQTLAASATIGGLFYTGHRREQGLAPMPFLDKLTKQADDKAEVKADPDTSTAVAAA